MRGWIPKTGVPTRIPLQDLLVEWAGPPVRISRTQHTPNNIYKFDNSGKVSAIEMGSRLVESG